MVTSNAINLSDQGVAYYNGIGSFAGIDGNTAGFVLTSNGTGVAPSFQASGISGKIGSIGVDTTTGGGTNPVLPTIGGLVTFTGGQYASGAFGTRVLTINSPAANTVDVEVQISNISAASNMNLNGVAHFNSADFTVDANGFVTATTTTSNYTNVNHAASPYTVLSTDEYISVDTSGGVVTLNFPNAPTFKRQWVVKDRTGTCATSNITITTPGATVTFDGLTSYTMNSNFQAINLLANAAPTYEVF